MKIPGQQSKRSRLATILVATVTVLCWPSAARACPYCRSAAGDLSDPKTQSTGDSDAADAALNGSDLPADGAVDPNRWFHGAAGVDFVSTYVSQGFVEANEGIIAQPFLTWVPPKIELGERFRLEPYITSNNTLLDHSNGTIFHQHGTSQSIVTKTKRQRFAPHPGQEYWHYHDVTYSALDGPNGKIWYDSKLTIGTLLTWRDLQVDMKYMACFYPDGSHDIDQELSAKVSYDIASFWASAADRNYTLRPFFIGVREIDDDNGKENTYFEYGIEGRWHGKVLGQSVGVSLPLTYCASPDGYFIDTLGEKQWNGGFNVGPTVSWKMPISERFATFLNASVRFYQFDAFNARESNDGDRSLWVGSLGISVAF